VRIFDALLRRTLVYRQRAVPVAHGVFTISLDPTGDANDGSTTPLTTSLATAIAGDATLGEPLAAPPIPLAAGDTLRAGFVPVARGRASAP
jgi:hypothetical protein